jgi:hypothetical protein
VSKDLDLCRDCQVERPAYIGGRMYMRCVSCLQKYDAKRTANRQAKLRRQAEAIRNA